MLHVIFHAKYVIILYKDSMFPLYVCYDPSFHLVNQYAFLMILIGRHAFPSCHNITVSLSLLYTASFYLCLNLIYILHKWPQRKLYSCTHCCSYKSQNKKNTYNWWFCSIFLYDGWWVPFISECTNAEFICDVVRLLNFDLRVATYLWIWWLNLW